MERSDFCLERSSSYMERSTTSDFEVTFGWGEMTVIVNRTKPNQKPIEPNRSMGVRLVRHLVASSRRSVSQGAAQKTARKKIKKSAARGSERTPVGKLNKRSFRPLIDRLQRLVTWPPACGFQLSTFLWNMLTEYFKLYPSNWKPKLRDCKTYSAIEMSLNKA